jgi:hypothetical protein
VSVGLSNRKTGTLPALPAPEQQFNADQRRRNDRYRSFGLRQLARKATRLPCLEGPGAIFQSDC